MPSDSFTRARPPRNLDIGLVLRRAFWMIGKHWRAFLAYLTVLIWAPNAIVRLAGVYNFEKYKAFDQLLSWYGRLLLFSLPTLFLFEPLFIALIAWTAAADSTPERADPQAALGAVLRQLPWLVVLHLLTLLAYWFGLILLIVPGVMVYLAFFVATPVCAVEGLRPLAAISRSRFLTRGQRWRLFGVFIITSVASYGLSMIANMTAAAFGVQMTTTASVAPILMVTAVTSLARLFVVACQASAYVELVDVKEAGGAQLVAEVFA